MTRSLYLLLSLLAASISVPGAAWAQQRTGRIEGTIYDDEGNPLAGARVTVSSETQIGGPKSGTTDAQGAFRFLGLIPGVFSLKVERAGFVSAVRDSLRVSVNRTVTLDILLDRAAAPPPSKKQVPPPKGTPDDPKRGQQKPDAPTGPDSDRAGAIVPSRPAGETYVIKAARPVVDVTRATTGESLSDEYLEAVPLPGRSYQSVAGMTRAVTNRRNPSGSGAGNPSISGGAHFNNTYLVDGMSVTDPVTHTFGTNFNFDSMADVQIMTGGIGAEYSDTLGGVINMVTKSGGNKLTLDASLYYQDDALSIKRPDEIGSEFSNLDFNLNVGGPIVKDKLWYYTSVQLSRNVSTVSPDPKGILPDHPARRFVGVRALGKLTWQVNPKHKLVLWVHADPATIDNTLNRITVEPDAEAHQNQYGTIGVLGWEWLAGEKLFVKSQLGVGWNGLRVFPESGNEQASAISDIGTGVAQRNYSRVLTDDRYRISLHGSATYFADDKLGDHELKAGFRFDHLINPSDERITGNETFSTSFGQPFSRTRYFLDFDETSACDPLAPGYDPAKCRRGALSTTVRGNKAILFFEDKWRLPGYKRLRLIPGVALHLANSQNPDDETVTEFIASTLHLNAAWDVFGDGKTVVRAGYNQYVDLGFLSIPRFIGRDLITHTCNYDEATRTYSNNCRIGGRTRTVGVPRPEFDAEGNVVNRLNPDALSPPRVHEGILGIEREWLTGFSTGFDFQYRRYLHQWEDLETNVIWNELGDNSQGFRNGKTEFIFDLETPEQAFRRYIGFSLFARKFVGNWQLTASYTWSRYTGTVAEGFATVFLDRPRQEQFFSGPLPDDRRHVLKLSGWYRFREILTVGGSMWVGTGTPYDRLYFNSFFNDYADRRATRGTDPRDLTTPDDDVELRMPTRLVLDLKLVYNLRHLTRAVIGEAHNLELIGEVFNVFNLRTASQYEERNLEPGAPTRFGEVINRQQPFRVRFGLRYRY